MNTNIIETKTRTLTGWEGWNTISMALYRATAGSDEGYEIFLAWCKKNPFKFNEKYSHYTWYVRYRRSPPKSVGAGTLFAIAETYQPGWQKIWNAEHPEEKETFKQEQRTKEELNTGAAIEKGEYSIKVYDDDIYKAVDLTEECLIKNQNPLYIYGGKLVTPVKRKVRTMHEGEKATIVSFSDVEFDFLIDQVNRFIDYKKYDVRQKDWKSVDPPAKVISRLLARVSKLRFPQVTGLITTPTMRADGTLLLQAGYDEVTGLLLVDPPAIPSIPESRGDAFEAIELLEELISEFSFVDDTAKSVALAAIITPVVRGAFPLAPMFVNKAPAPASGKSYLFDIVAAIVIGQRAMPTTAASRHNEETEKRVGASLIAGEPLINIDNVDVALGGGWLCQYLERQLVNVWVLGKSENRNAETGGTTLFATGNNIVLVDDVTRRVVICALDTNEERPELHQYKKKPVKMVLANCGKYIAACLTICKAYIAVGSPDKRKPLGSYEEWSDVVRSAIVWLGRKDPVESMNSARAEDPKLRHLEAIILEWVRVIGSGEASSMHLNKVFELCQEKSDTGFDRYDKPLKYPDFYNAICEVASVYGRPPDAKRFSDYMHGVKGRLVKGMKLVSKTPPSGGAARWWVQHGDDPLKNSPGLRHGDKRSKCPFP